MKKIGRWSMVAAVIVLVTYAGTYAVLRLGKYFIRQQFLCLGCSPSMMKRIQRDFPKPKGLIQVASDRNQIGCGKIQKDEKRFGESILLPLFRPLGEVEMRLRGFNAVMIAVTDGVDEPAGSEGSFLRETLLTNYPATRRDQSF
jgi:hypothetical protein